MAAKLDLPKHSLRLYASDPRPACLSADGLKSDSVDLAHVSIVRVGSVAGDVKVRDYDGNDTVIPNVQIGETLPVLVVRIWSTGTTATGLTIFY